MSPHGGRLAVDVLGSHGVDTIFTLSGGHLFVLYDGCVQAGLRLVDTRHEQSAAFAAEGYAKVTRRAGCAALTAGPGVTNGVSAMTSMSMNGSPVLVLAGRAPMARWGSGSLQELDHLPIVESVVKSAATATDAASIVAEVHAALLAARTPHRGPTFVDIPLDAFASGDVTIPGAEQAEISSEEPDPEAIAEVAGLLGAAERPVLVAGGDVYWGGAEGALVRLAEAARVPVFVNGMGRGTIPADHDLAFSRTRGVAFKGADLVVVAGTPLDFRLAFGKFGDARVVHLCDSAAGVARHVELAAAVAGDLALALSALAESGVPPAARSSHDAWIERLRDQEKVLRDADVDSLGADASPIKPTRVYGELRKRLERDAIVIGDGGDFVSYAGKYVDSYLPGTFLDPGPYGCLGMGPGYALGAGVACPDRRIVLLLGDGATGFALGDFDSLVRHGVNVTAIVGNNGIWGLEKHPMQQFFGYDVVADLRPGTRYDKVVEALGGRGELVAEPSQIGPALDRAFETPGVSLVNVLTDPEDAYPRSSNLA
ncbi:MAG: acetolactate synthase [Acidimicrobiia bacterium]|nr:acetolactate synthase [Acidimicrobiia bacterium]